ncbi:Sugar kinase of the NBD/HSP70 family, may contain an N-terminal HTH domain [Roseivivax lentus]|uniref:Sugar kinase of the NBD/HSP70 family, may contain an N-terminal HTH domain n=1 Tax=Roseivivax lentus TaxID=633194 RepID=A0A1N7K8D8_9RHOB|nr:ROK family transcriptional regulator [Roseivivax lentus]SIS57849.1 Sugar kinase of the NBD/HSP70 family, may contain an N-terminal HTH domain [Roseivivax lentus]
MSRSASTQQEPARIEIAPELRGSNQSGLRAHNERLVLSLVRRHGALAKADIARRTGLSAQTVSVIMRQLEAEGLLIKGDPVRGKVGQPLVPMRLAPGGAYFLGLKIGRRSAEVVLIDFMGQVIDRTMTVHDFPTPDGMIAFARDSIETLTAPLSAVQRARIAGLGIAMPFQIWEWAGLIGIDPALMEAWRHRDIRDEIAAMIDLPVFLQNDASAACGAELTFGGAHSGETYLYFYIGYFIGGGIVLNGALFTGPTGNAAAVGPTPVPSGHGFTHLMDVASLSTLERMLKRGGIETGRMWLSPDDWPFDLAACDAWVDLAADALAHAISSAIAFVDFPCIVIDGWMPAPLRDRLVAGTERALGGLDMVGLVPPVIEPGNVGPDARAMGAASLPLSERFLLDTGGLLGAH